MQRVKRMKVSATSVRFKSRPLKIEGNVAKKQKKLKKKKVFSRKISSKFADTLETPQKSTQHHNTTSWLTALFRALRLWGILGTVVFISDR